MQVHTIQSNNYTSYNSPNFGKLYLTEPAEKLIKSWEGAAEKLQKIDIWKNELAETKNFDLEIDELCKRLFITIKSKNSDWQSCEAPLRVDNEPKNKKLLVYGIDLLDCGDWVTYSLKCTSDVDAKEAYNILKAYQDDPSISTINKIAWAVDSVKVLEKGTTAKSKTVINSKGSEKLPFIKRLKNAWLVLTGQQV